RVDAGGKREGVTGIPAAGSHWRAGRRKRIVTRGQKSRARAASGEQRKIRIETTRGNRSSGGVGSTRRVGGPAVAITLNRDRLGRGDLENHGEQTVRVKRIERSRKRESVCPASSGRKQRERQNRQNA